MFLAYCFNLGIFCETVDLGRALKEVGIAPVVRNRSIVAKSRTWLGNWTTRNIYSLRAGKLHLPESLPPCTGKSGMTKSLEVLAKEEDKNLNLYHNHPGLLGDSNFHNWLSINLLFCL